MLFIIFLSISSYFIDLNFFPPYGHYANYNEVKFENLNYLNSIKIIYNYLTFFIFYFWIPFLYFFILKLKGQNIKFQNLFEKKIIGDYFVTIIIFASSFQLISPSAF